MHQLAEPTNQHRAVAPVTPEQRIEQFLLRCQQTDLSTRHYIVRTPHGVVLYAREIRIPADTVLTGAAHKLPHLVTVCGDITASTDAGVQRLTGMHTFTAPAGKKRVGVTHSDTVWTNYHVVISDNIDEIEEELTDEFDMLQTRRGLLPFDIHRALEG